MNECCSGAAMCSSHISYVKHTVNPYSTDWLCYRFIMRATISSLSALDVCVARLLHSHSSKKQVFGERSADVYRKTFHMKKKKKKAICQLVRLAYSLLPGFQCEPKTSLICNNTPISRRKKAQVESLTLMTAVFHLGELGPELWYCALSLTATWPSLKLSVTLMAFLTNSQ